MNWKDFVGPATLIYIIASSSAGIWWASDLSARVAATEHSLAGFSSSTDRLTRVETLILHIDKQLDRIERQRDNETARNSPRR